jgi:signal transduction histidine kinase
MYTVAVQLPIQRSLVACIIAVLVMVVEALQLFVSGSLGERADAVLPWTGWLFAPWAIGAVMRLVRQAREEESRERTYAERLRIAREVHDVVAHGLAAISVQAKVALHVLDRRPEQARLALQAINQSSQDALDELHATLAVFRTHGDTAAGSERDGRRPSAALAELDRLVSRMGDSGLRVTVKINGARPDMPPAVDLAAYRIIQESLTNVLRHAGSATARVRVNYRPDAIDVEVLDDGKARPGRPLGAGGHGIAGMRERAAALGGSLQAEPRPEGGFRVHAQLPITAPDASQRTVPV